MTSNIFKMSRTRSVSVRGRLSSGRPNPIDAHFGERLRRCRLLSGMNQEELGKAVGLTSQQVQKYEHAINRVTASRLWDFSIALKCPVTLFFEGITDEISAASPRHLPVVDGSEPTDQSQDDRSFNREMLELARAYHAIKPESARRQVLELVRGLGRGNDGNETAS